MLVVPSFQCLRHVHAVGVADDHVQSAVFASVLCDSSLVLMIGRSKVVCKPHFDMDVVGTLAELVARDLAMFANADAAGADVDLSGDEVGGS